MTEGTIDLVVSVGAQGADKRDLETLALGLADELRELDAVESAGPVPAGEPPSGAKGAALGAGALLVKLAEAGGVAGLFSLLGSWLSRDKSRTLKLQLGDKSLKLTGLSQDEQREIVQWFKTQAGLRLDR